MTGSDLVNINIYFPSVLRHCWLGDRKGIIQPVKSWVLVCWWWQFDWRFARLTSPDVTTTSIILSSNKIQKILNILRPGLCGDDPLAMVRLPQRSFSSQSLASTDNLTEITRRHNTYQLKLTIHKSGPNEQQHNRKSYIKTMIRQSLV